MAILVPARILATMPPTCLNLGVSRKDKVGAPSLDCGYDCPHHGIVNRRRFLKMPSAAGLPLCAVEPLAAGTAGENNRVELIGCTRLKPELERQSRPARGEK